MAFPWLARDGLAPWVVRRLYLFWSNHQSAWVDVTATLDRKLEALRAHPSQIRHPERLEQRIRDWGREEGEAIGAKAAEAFRVIVIEDDAEVDEGPTHLTPPDTEGADPAGA
jgi:LmbE family N-acetylglucosaminyl deacetylase